MQHQSPTGRIAAQNAFTIELSDLRGQVVCLDFWSTWCGPCQTALEKLNQLASQNRPAWKDRAHIIALSIDDQPRTVADHFERNGWRQAENYWDGTSDSIGFQSPAAKAFGIQAVPTTFLNGRDGKILWTGSANAKDVSIETLIQNAIDQP